MQTHIRILAWLYIVPCCLGLMAGLMLCLVLSLDHHMGAPTTFDYIAPFFLLFSVFLLPGAIGGFGLLRFRPWAKVLILILSVLLIPMLPIGTAVGAYGFRVLLRPETSGLLAGPPPPRSRRWDRKDFSYQPSAQLDLLVLITCVGAFIYLGLVIGFALHTDPTPLEFRSKRLIATAILVLVAGAAFWIWRVVNARGAVRANARNAAQRRMNSPGGSIPSQAPEFAPHSPPANHASTPLHGDDPSAASLAYLSNREMTVTCEHLQAIERSMRQAGIDAKLSRNTNVSSHCRIDMESLRAAFDVAGSVRYAEFFAGEAIDYEHPTAFLICDEHKSLIHTIHPEESGAAKAPLFPAGRP